MEVRALETFETFGLLARLRLVHERMEELLLPTMALTAPLQALATFFVARDEGATLPVLAQVDVIGEQVGPSAEILKVVRVHALSLVVVVVKWTPLCLEVEHVEVEVGAGIRGDDLVDESHFDVFDRVGEAAEVAVLALADLVGVEVAKLRFVFLAVVEPFDPVVGPFATVTFRTSI